MRLFVMRHGPAEDRAPSGRDFDRALTDDGRDVVRRAARLLAARAPVPPRVIASPFRRAQQTAELVAAALGAGEPELHDDLGADAEVPRALVRELRAEGRDALLVGHQPFVEALVRQLIDPTPLSLPAGFRTALVVALEVEAGAEGLRLQAVLDPHAASGA